MSIDEMKDKKVQLEEDILNLIKEFESDTHIEDIDIKTNRCRNINTDCNFIQSVSV